MTSCTSSYPTIPHQRTALHTLCCALFGASYIEPILPNGSVYVAGAVGIIAALGGIVFYVQRKKAPRLSIIDLLFLIYLAYILLNTHTPIDIGNGIKIVSIAGVWWCVRQFEYINWPTIALWALCSGVIQTGIGLLQWTGVIASNHTDFAATGTFNNPGVWGGYLAIMLALALPYALSCTQRKVLIWTGCACIVMGIFLSYARAAWLATIVIGCLLLLQHKRLELKTRHYLALAPTFVLLGYLLYLLRPASVAARWHIWQVSLSMFSQSPLWGLGTGEFAVHYMPTQAAFLTTATPEVQRLADDNLLAFNDLLLILCEQGTFGFILFILLAYTCLYFLFKGMPKLYIQWLLLPLAAMCSFALFSYFSSLWSLLIFLPCLASTIQAPSISTIRYRMATLWLTAISSFTVFIGLLYIGRAHHWINKYGDFQESSSIPPTIVFWVRHDAFLVTALCEQAWLIEDHNCLIDYAPIMACYHQTARWTQNLGESYEAVGDTTQAIMCYQQAHRMVPGRLLPLYAQFALWRDIGNTFKAKQLAQQVLQHTPKIQNNRTHQMKYEAQQYLFSTP